MAAMNVQANDYLEQKKHYMVYPAGMDHIHFKVPVWAYGKVRNYYLSDQSRIYYVKDGQEHIIAHVSTDPYGENESSSEKGSVFFQMASNMGSIQITSMATGAPYFVTGNDQWTERLYVYQKEDDDCPQVTFLEFDWYPPSSMYGQGKIHIKINPHINWSKTEKEWYNLDWDFGSFDPGNMLSTPQLFSPFLYTLNEYGVTGYGNAGIPYTLFYEPLSYRTSQAPTQEIVLKETERSGNIFVMTSDTVIEQVTAYFKVKYNAAGDTTTLKSTAVDVLPYHRIYDFKATEELDETGTYTGNNKLEWKVKNPMLKDLIEGDYFELQRATKSDYSDAQTLNVIQMVRKQDGSYSYVDQSREIWTGNGAIQTDTVKDEEKVSVTAKGYLLRTADGQPLCNVDIDYFTNMVLKPSVPVYYRIRRASSAVWGWEGHDFTRKTTMQKHNFLAPLSETQEHYTLDPDYETNHKVYFRIKIENASVNQYSIPDKSKFMLSYSNVTMPVGADNKVNVIVVNRLPQAIISAMNIDNGEVEMKEDTIQAGIKTYEITSGSQLMVKYPSYMIGTSVNQWKTELYTIEHAATVTLSKETAPYVTTGSCSINTDGPTRELVQEALNRVQAHLSDSLYNEASALISSEGEQLGKCMWDKTAHLILQRTMVETGQTVEFIVPNDSIHRQPDGSWIATMTDEASSACTHYHYSVRIDQTQSDLRFYDPEKQTKPVTIVGPELYYDEGAAITEFTATKGQTSDYLKQGVLLNWTATSANVDEYRILRLKKNSDQTPDTFFVGTENTYFDRTSIPNVRYEYTVVALYECNSKLTVNSATTEGWRTPYGEIQGIIQMSDNSGISGVTVALQKDGETVRTMTTKADGVFRFDSLLYDLQGGTSYVITPTATYGTFGYNYTTSPSATISLTTSNPIASNVLFINTDAVRLTGRVLYKGSTIPVAGAMFLLNGDTIRRNHAPLTTGIDGNFELILTKGQPYRLQVFKSHHNFEGDGILRVEGESEIFALDKALDGVRFYDQTKVRLVGRVAGGNDQRDLPEGYGLGKNNLGDDLQLVLQLEGDNTAQIVHDPNDETRDTIHQTVGNTETLFEKKRITIHPDVETGEYAVDLFPVKYKVIQATARGYATLFAAGQGSETFDLTNTPRDTFHAVYSAQKDSVILEYKQDGQLKSTTLIAVKAPRGTLHDGDQVTYNAVYDRIYHTPAKVHLTQLIYGMEKDGYGEPSMPVTSFDSVPENVSLYTAVTSPNGIKHVSYTLGYPIFYNKRSYQFAVAAYEEYYYNNDPQGGARDLVPMRSGRVLVHNGMKGTGGAIPSTLDGQGKCTILLQVDNLDVTFTGEMALRTVTAALEYEGNVVETEVFRAYIAGDKIQEKSLHSTEANIALLDIVRNPGGTGSNSWVESGATYHYSYKESYKWELGINLNIKYGLDVSADIGVITGVPGGQTYSGFNYATSRQFIIPLPFTHKWDWGYQYDYTFTTTEKISTATSGSIYNYGGLADASAGVGYAVGGMADVFVGSTISQLSGKAKTISIINDSIYNLKREAFKAGTMRVIADGEDANGNHYYLVNAEKVVLGSQLGNTFVYSQYYILNTVMPRLAMERQNLLMHFPDSAAAVAAADLMGKPVYWLRDTSEVSMQDTLPKKYYRMICPSKTTHLFNDEVAALNNMLRNWSNILIHNEKEKVIARMAGRREGTYSVSFGNVYSRTDTYASCLGYNHVPQGKILSMEAKTAGTQAATTLVQNHQSVWNFFSQMGASTIGKAAEDALDDFYKWEDEFDENGNETGMITRTDEFKNTEELGAKDNQSKFSYTLTPVFNFNADLRAADDKTSRKSCGFSLVPDAYGDITVSVYRAQLDQTWEDTTRAVRSYIEKLNLANDSMLYGSYVFFTEAGATFCPYEGEYRTAFYNPGTLLSNATVPIAEPELTANTYEVAHVQPDQPAYIRIEMKNNGQLGEGRLSDFRNFELGMVNASNADGLEVYADGTSLAAPIPINILPGQTAYKTLKIMRGTVDDYNDLKLRLYVASCPKNFADMSFSVHFIPQSTPVAIMTPRPNWVMNTLSPRDSAGYYLPIEIGEFDITKNNFDHIEFQYKLSTQSDEMWVNLCSFYASDSLYNRATGNKAMIENGRIAPFRFYGEKDPVEQKYDLRAVSFCRYGTGFVTKSSPVITGVKDTRPPRVFGEPEPVNAILGVGDNLKLRFNEPIAGNYLDEDNNFQLRGVTNSIGITSGTSLHFDGSENSYAVSQVNRSLKNSSFTIDMLVMPSDPNGKAVFFSHADESDSLLFGLDERHQLFLYGDDYRVSSQPIGTILDFTRVCVVYNRDKHTVRFYVGTKEVTDPVELYVDDFVSFDVAAPVCLGKGFDGNMLEARLWLKALTQEEIAATHLRSLTGYERELMAYYPLNEGMGSIAKDRANGANLTLNGATWHLPKGISVHLGAKDSLMLASNYLSRSSVYDATYMFWFRAEKDGSLFRAGRVETDTTQRGLKIALENGALTLYCDSNKYQMSEFRIQNSEVRFQISDGAWHHMVFAVNRTYNNASLFLDGQLVGFTNATEVPTISGDMYLGGGGFEGNIDEFVLFEQALPKSLIEEYGNRSPYGDEMGLMAYLPFEQQVRNPNGILELVFSVNDRRIFKDPNGNIINKTVPLVLEHGTSSVPTFADKVIYAPVTGAGLLTPLHFDWAFNNDELMINLAMNDREINKQSIYITVRDVEDLNGNPMPSPVTWLAYVDRNNLKWGEPDMQLYALYGETNSTTNTREMKIINNSGKRHQYTIESLPEWLTLKQSSGSLQPIEDKTVTFTYSVELPVGVYTDLIYLTDENGLTEPLRAELTIEAQAPYDEVDKTKYPLNMSLCGQVILNETFDSDERDIVYAMCKDECVGMANISFDAVANKSKLFITIYGNDAMNRKPIRFRLWQASTGKVFDLTPSRDIQFSQGAVYGCGDGQIVILSSNGNERQTVALQPGWNWTSFYLDLRQYTSKIANVMTVDKPWSEGDLIKNPATRHFTTYSEALDGFMGDFDYLRYIYTYMIYSKAGNTMHISGNNLPADSMYVIVNGNGQWSAMPCLFNQVTPITEALSDYYTDATPGDMIKSHDHFAYFSEDKKWEGDLSTMRPGEGYFFRRMAQGDVRIRFFNKPTSAPRRTSLPLREESEVDFHAPSATNMTMIAKISGLEDERVSGLEDERISGLEVYIGDELVGRAEPMDSLYYVTVQSDVLGGTLRFEMDGQALVPESGVINYKANEHFGTLKSPVLLTPLPSTGRSGEAPYKLIEDDHVVIIRNGEKYDVTGKKL